MAAAVPARPPPWRPMHPCPAGARPPPTPSQVPIIKARMPLARLVPGLQLPAHAAQAAAQADAQPKVRPHPPLACFRTLVQLGF